MRIMANNVMTEDEKISEIKNLNSALEFLKDDFKRRALKMVVLERIEMGEKINFQYETERIERAALKRMELEISRQATDTTLTDYDNQSISYSSDTTVESAPSHDGIQDRR